MVEKKKEENAEEDAKISKPSWVKMKPAELEKLVVELARKGEGPAKIGLILRDKYGVPKARVFGKKIGQILRENKINYKSDSEIVNDRVENLKRHIIKNKRDYPASRALSKKLWVVNKAKK